MQDSDDYVKVAAELRDHEMQLDKHLSSEQVAMSHVVRRTVGDHLILAGEYFRWVAQYGQSSLLTLLIVFHI